MDPSKYHQVSGDDPSLRRTQSSSVAKKRSDDNRQTLVGSIAISDLVTQQFAPRLSRQQTFSIGSTPMRSAPRSQIHAVVIPPGSQPSNSLSSKERSKFCPHCGKQYSSPWAVPKHVQVCTHHYAHPFVLKYYFNFFFRWTLTLISFFLTVSALYPSFCRECMIVPEFSTARNAPLNHRLKTRCYSMRGPPTGRARIASKFSSF